MLPHKRIVLNVSTELNFAFRQQDYEVFMGDVRLWIPQKRIYTYPDVMVIVGELLRCTFYNLYAARLSPKLIKMCFFHFLRGGLILLTFDF